MPVLVWRSAGNNTTKILQFISVLCYNGYWLNHYVQEL